MLRVINLLCKNNNIDSLNEYNLKELFHFKEKKTGDNIILYTARCGNVNLLRVLFEEQKHLESNYFK